MILILILLFTICYSNDQLEYKIKIFNSPKDNQIGLITCKFNIESYTKYICNNIINCDKKPNSDITENELFFIEGLCRDTSISYVNHNYEKLYHDTLISYFNHNYFDLTPTTTKFDSTGSWCVNFKISLVRPRVYDTIKEYNTKIITQDTIKKYVTVYDTIKEYNKIQQYTQTNNMKSELVSNFNVELFLTGFIKENKGLFDAITSDLLNIGCLSLNSNGVYGEIGITTSYRNDGSYRTGGTGLYVGLGGKSEFFNFNINLAIGYWKTYYDSIYNESPEINHSYFYPFTRLTIGPEKFGIVGVLGFKTGYPTYSIGLYTNFYKF